MAKQVTVSDIPSPSTGTPRLSGPSENLSGRAHVFVRIFGIWIAQAVLVASDGAANDFFGSSVAVRGNQIVVGAPYDDIMIPSRTVSIAKTPASLTG
jgi:hypothetical protein